MQSTFQRLRMLSIVKNVTHNTYQPPLVGGLLAFILLACSFFANQALATPDLLKNKFSLVDRFITASKTAERIATKGTPEVKAQMAQAKDIFAQAQQAHSAGDAKKAGALLDQALKIATLAAQKSADPASKLWLHSARFDDMLGSVNNFLSSFKRYLAQSGKSDANNLSKIQNLIQSAKQLAGKKEYQSANKKLDQAQIILTESIKNVLGSNSLVYELKFDTPNDEYKYEVDRGDSFEALVRMLLIQKAQDGSKQKLIEPLVAQHLELRSQARNQAASGAFEQAIKTQEDANKFLIRALRTLGLMIPM